MEITEKFTTDKHGYTQISKKMLNIKFNPKLILCLSVLIRGLTY